MTFAEMFPLPTANLSEDMIDTWLFSHEFYIHLLYWKVKSTKLKKKPGLWRWFIWFNFWRRKLNRWWTNSSFSKVFGCGQKIKQKQKQTVSMLAQVYCCRTSVFIKSILVTINLSTLESEGNAFKAVFTFLLFFDFFFHPLNLCKCVHVRVEWVHVCICTGGDGTSTDVILQFLCMFLITGTLAWNSSRWQSWVSVSPKYLLTLLHPHWDCSQCPTMPCFYVGLGIELVVVILLPRQALYRSRFLPTHLRNFPFISLINFID